ncbi:hypothetical protein NC658_03795 [Streptomyces griseoincarnatus]|uniref:Deoxyribonuclease NucA/NucB domain-containing protein n=1 Tax=Streptomyces griseoincarnatus TaxID=29305 RepID=A0ABT0VM00_STRGI|nr:hypothetical protein [Streptomyces griseoincarnatus]MCM2512383.1 hypothetical protein [Streptomyces griseoincarnatus]
MQSLTLRMQVGCGTGCTTVTKQPWYASTLSDNGEVTGKTKYRGDPFARGKTRVSFRNNYAMYVTMPGATSIDSNATWSSPAGGEIRCDAEQPRLRGCVIPTNDLPALSYSRSHEKYGIVVPIYEEIMRRRGTDILHAVGLAQATVNRNATCTPFTNLYPSTRGADSCDEFPPASTKEGGQDGTLCAELTPQVVKQRVVRTRDLGQPTGHRHGDLSAAEHYPARQQLRRRCPRLPAQVPAPGDGRPVPHRVHRLNRAR